MKNIERIKTVFLSQKAQKGVGGSLWIEIVIEIVIVIEISWQNRFSSVRDRSGNPLKILFSFF